MAVFSFADQLRLGCLLQTLGRNVSVEADVKWMLYGSRANGFALTNSAAIHPRDARTRAPTHCIVDDRSLRPEVLLAMACSPACECAGRSDRRSHREFAPHDQESLSLTNPAADRL